MLERSGQPWSADDDETLLRMFAAGERRRDIAATLGRSESSVSSRRINLARQGRGPVRYLHGRTSNRESPWSAEDWVTLRQMLSDGINPLTIARALRRRQTEVASKARALAQTSVADV